VVRFDEEHLPVLSFFEEPTVSGDTFLVMIENTTLRHVLWEQFSSQVVHHLTSPAVFVPFWTGSILIVVLEEGVPFPGSLVPQM
jgi:hypothetical protein